MLKQEVQPDGTIRVEVVGITDRARCAHCQNMCVKQHDVRPRSKRDVPLREHRVELVLYKRRFWCLRCRKAFTEPDRACGRGKRTTVRLREVIGKQEDVVRLLERLTDCDAVEAVSMDMSESFRGAVQLCLPRAHIVADHFHVIQHVGKAVKQVVTRWAKSEVGKPALKGHQHLFLRNQEDLSIEEEQTRASLARAFPEIAVAWQLKEDLRSWYAIASASTAANSLDAWIAIVRHDGPAEVCKALSAFRNWRREILAFFDYLPTRVSNGFVEGKNNRTKAIMRQGYGYRNRRNLRLRILLEVT